MIIFKEKFDLEYPEVGFEEQEDYDQAFKEWINSDKMKEEHHQFAIRHEIHSEMNAMIFAAKKGIPTEGSDVYIVWSPMY